MFLHLQLHCMGHAVKNITVMISYLEATWGHYTASTQNNWHACLEPYNTVGCDVLPSTVDPSFVSL